MEQNRQKIFIGGLSRETTDTSLELFFARFGEIASAEVLRDHQTMNSRGFGFVTFRHDGMAESVIALGTRCPFVVDGKQVEVKSAVPREKTKPAVRKDSFSSSFPNRTYLNTRSNSELLFNTSLFDESFCDFNERGMNRSSSVMLTRSNPAGSIQGKIFVGGLPYTTGHEGLRRCFEQFGAVTSAEVIYNRETKKSRGFGFIIFLSQSSVDRVMLFQSVNPFMIDGKQIEVKPCKPKSSNNSSPKSSSIDFDSLLRELSNREYISDIAEQKDDGWYNGSSLNQRVDPFTSSSPLLYPMFE